MERYGPVIRAIPIPSHDGSRGGDLLVRGFPSGPELGAELARLERVWIDSGLVLDRDALLKQLKRQA